MSEATKPSPRKRLLGAVEIVVGLVFLWMALGDRIQRFAASGGREEAGYLGGLLGLFLAGLLVMVLLGLIGRLKGRAAAYGYLAVFSGVWLAFVAWALWSAEAFGAWLTGAGLAFGPILIVWGVVFGYLRKAPRQ
ncbi:hypothetical protein G5B46_07510 [Caulobacter sp. 602-2]|uniref:Uncharacterized protein n=1 Tax=Caulobacter sp. 602-2 TaxID=2710887 RepID=A0A6G4QWY4_9CAUL|nr:hypothetical protein [Caulobacter sp. 602-2]NGM49448.1 hypothetical protein [Caulobacter sp. 602-2]